MPSPARTPQPAGRGSARLTTLLLCGVMFLQPHRAFALAATEQLLCGDVEKVTIDAGQYATLKKAVQQGDRLTVWIWYGISPDALKRAPNARLENDWGLGYQLDNSAVTSIHPLVPSTQMTIALSFSHLKPGPHRMRIGLVDDTGELTQDNAYCFSSPGRFALTGR